MNTHTFPGPLQLFGITWQFYKTHWKSLTTIVLLPFAGIFIGNLISQVGLNLADTSLITARVLAAVGFLVFIAAVVFGIAAVSALISTVHKLDTEPQTPIHFWNQYKLGFRYFWPLMLIGVMRGLATFGATTIFVIPGIVFAVYSVFVLFLLVIDDKRNVSAFTESFTLVYGRWWKVFGRLLLIALTYIAGIFILTGICVVLQKIFGYPIHSFVDTLIKSVLVSALILFYLPFMASFIYKMFIALKHARAEVPQTKLFKDLFIAVLVIGSVIFIATILFGTILDPDMRTRRMVPYDAGLAITTSHNSHGNLVL